MSTEPTAEPTVPPRPRFIPMEQPPPGQEADERTRWWYDTHRPLIDSDQPYIAVQTEADKDANDYVRVEGEMFLLFNDAAEYYAVCSNCFYTYRHMQWAGSTRGGANWRERAERYLEKHQREKGWCQFCDPCFGSGGWYVGGHY